MISRLEDLCGIQIAVVLANKLEFKKEIVRLPDLESESWLKSMEEKVLDALKNIPFGLRDKIPTPAVIFCLTQSIKWAKFHKEEFDLPYDYCCHFLTSSFFTSKGLINKEKAAREILKDTEISSSIRFCMACYYCFSDVIPALWEQLPEDRKPKVKNGVYKNGLGTIWNHEMVILWSRYLLEELQITKDEEKSFLIKLILFFESDFLVSFKNCFEELKKFERKEVSILCRNHVLQNIFNTKKSRDPTCLFPHQLNLPFDSYIEMIIFLLHRLDEEELKVFIHPRILYFVLFHLLLWPYQHLFMNTVKRFFDQDLHFELHFCMLLERIVRLMKNKSASKLCDYQNILIDFWMQSPSSFKSVFFHFEGTNRAYFPKKFSINGKILFYDFYDWKHFGEEELSDSSVICNLFKSPFTIEDEIILRLIFESATLEQKSLILGIKGNMIGKIAFEACDLSRIEFFIDVCVPKERIASFKKGIFQDEDVKETLWDLVLNRKLKEVHNILNWDLCAEEIKELQQSLLICFKPSSFYYGSFNYLECFDEFLKWSLSSNEIENFKESLVSDENFRADLFFESRSSDDECFHHIDIFLK